MVKDEKDLFLKTGRNRVHPHNDRRTRGIENLIRWEGSWLADPWTYVSQKPLFTQSGKRIDRPPWTLRRKTPYDLRELKVAGLPVGRGIWRPFRYGSLYVPLAIGVSHPIIVRSIGSSVGFHTRVPRTVPSPNQYGRLCYGQQALV